MHMLADGHFCCCNATDCGGSVLAAALHEPAKLAGQSICFSALSLDPTALCGVCYRQVVD